MRVNNRLTFFRRPFKQNKTKKTSHLWEVECSVYTFGSHCLYKILNFFTSNVNKQKTLTPYKDFILFLGIILEIEVKIVIYINTGLYLLWINRDREAWPAAVHGVTKSRTWWGNRTTTDALCLLSALIFKVGILESAFVYHSQIPLSEVQDTLENICYLYTHIHIKIIAHNHLVLNLWLF